MFLIKSFSFNFTFHWSKNIKSISKSIFITPKNYQSSFSLMEVEAGIKALKDYFKKINNTLVISKISDPISVFLDTWIQW